MIACFVPPALFVHGHLAVLCFLTPSLLFIDSFHSYPVAFLDLLIAQDTQHTSNILPISAFLTLGCCPPEEPVNNLFSHFFILHFLFWIFRFFNFDFEPFNFVRPLGLRQENASQPPSKDLQGPSRSRGGITHSGNPLKPRRAELNQLHSFKFRTFFYSADPFADVFVFNKIGKYVDRALFLLHQKVLHKKLCFFWALQIPLG